MGFIFCDHLLVLAEDVLGGGEYAFELGSLAAVLECLVHGRLCAAAMNHHLEPVEKPTCEVIGGQFVL